MMRRALQVEWRWVPVSESENAERCQRLRELLLRGARRLSQSACPAKGLNASESEAILKAISPDSNLPASGEQINPAEQKVNKGMNHEIDN